MKIQNNKKITNKKNFCPLIGAKKELSQTKLPTYQDIFRHYLWLDTKWNPYEKLYKQIYIIWQKTGIPLCDKSNAIRELKKFHKKYLLVRKLFKGKLTQKNDEKIVKFKEQCQKLYDIAYCKCALNCKCGETKQVPVCQKAFLRDQRSSRLLSIQEQIVKKVSKQKKMSSKSSEPTIDLMADDESDTVTESDVVDRKLFL